MEGLSASIFAGARQPHLYAPYSPESSVLRSKFPAEIYRDKVRHNGENYRFANVIQLALSGSEVAGGHSGSVSESGAKLKSAPPTGGSVSVTAEAGFGYWFDADPDEQLPDGATDALKRLGALMVPDADQPDQDSDLPPVMTYWGQFLDHELTARTDGDGAFTDIAAGGPTRSRSKIELGLKNACTPRFDLDSV